MPHQIYLKTDLGGGKRAVVPYYCSDRKTELLKMLGPPLNLTMAEVARREGVTEMSLYTWRKRASAAGYVVVTDPKHPTESWSAKKKFAAVTECASLFVSAP